MLSKYEFGIFCQEVDMKCCRSESARRNVTTLKSKVTKQITQNAFATSPPGSPYVHILSPSQRDLKCLHWFEESGFRRAFIKNIT